MKSDPRAIQALKSRMGIADVIRRYMALKPAGSRLVGLCPFHNEKTPSFSVNPDKGVFYCFGCQASGDVIDFYCRINGLDFREGLEQLAREAGVALADYKPDPKEEQRRRQRQAGALMHSLARDHYRERLHGPEGASAREYLDRRGVSPEMAELFQLGYAPADYHGLEGLLRRKGYREQDAVEAGLLVRGDDGRVWDRFRDRLMFPIHEVSGKVVAFGGRVMGEGEPKYLNSSDSTVYKKGEHLYGLHQARPHFTKAGRALLTEGYLDVIALHQHGFREACGVLGTALTPQQVKRLTGFVRHVALVFDGDAAGLKAGLRSARMLLAQGAECRVALMPQGEDADSLLKAGGARAFQACLDEARDGIDFCLSTVRASRSSKEVVDWALEFLEELASDAVRAAMLTRLAHGLGVGEHELRNLAARRGARPRQGREQGGEQGRGGEGPKGAPAGGKERAPSVEARADAQVLEFAIRCPDFLPEMERFGVFETLATQRARAFWRLLARYGQSDVLPYLDERQKRFWGLCASKDPLPEEEARRWWEDITAHADKVRAEERRRELIEAMRVARDRGDSEEEKRLMAAFSELVGRNQ
ncbi:DNA primase [Fundidesulfovibrio magnetotacticus]|uniref:DNA primase n=1 Tax=Fundidesulfovibrio magnetotacticus TaxID=2730080 RepID=A0A6V8LVI2_9BACT|nr:DNA primase [Fundidesulfovibrio magnetotacticus]GFK92255.1 DNA primase [Fundidesulfovibrio magnetotacticus]